MAWTTTELLQRWRLYAFLSATDTTLSNAEGLNILDDELQAHCFPRLLAAFEEWRVTSEDTALVAGQNAYRLPTRAHAQRLRDVLYVDSAGNAYSLPIIDPEELGTRFVGTQQRTPQVFYLRDGSVVLWPTPAAAVGSVRMSYYCMPGTLVETADCGLISEVTTVHTLGDDFYQITCSEYPEAFQSGVLYVDVVAADGGFETLCMDQLRLTAVTPGEYLLPITAFDATFVPRAGDWLCAAGTSCIPQIPAPLHMWLARRGVVSAMDILSNDKAMERAQVKADEAEARIRDLISPRVDGEPKVFVPIYSALRGIAS